MDKNLCFITSGGHEVDIYLRILVAALRCLFRYKNVQLAKLMTSITSIPSGDVEHAHIAYGL